MYGDGRQAEMGKKGDGVVRKITQSGLEPKWVIPDTRSSDTMGLQRYQCPPPLHCDQTSEPELTWEVMCVAATPMPFAVYAEGV